MGFILFAAVVLFINGVDLDKLRQFIDDNGD